MNQTADEQWTSLNGAAVARLAAEMLHLPGRWSTDTAELLSAMVWDAAARNPGDQDLAALTDRFSPPGVAAALDWVMGFREMVDCARRDVTPAVHDEAVAELVDIASHALQSGCRRGGLSVNEISAASAQSAAVYQRIYAAASNPDAGTQDDDELPPSCPTR